MFRKVLVANRGEIALRVLNACRELGIRTVAVYSEADRNSLHVRFADEAICIGPPRAADSYLNVPAVISAAEIADVEAIHPGYGLLSENANFAEVCRASNIKFIGPPPEVTRLMGEKEKARQAMKKAKVPILPGSDGILTTAEEARAWAAKVGYPVILKAKAGGGGRGMRIVRDAEDLPNLFHAAFTEAANAFGNGELYMEKFIEQPRHIEFQVLADEHGNVASLFERECSIQRRHQKLIEEAPSLQVTPKMREEVGRTLCHCMKEIGYQNAGTVEFLMDASHQLYFIEMNTRIQVEHPVTEAITGVDLVKAQLRIAAGERLDAILPAKLEMRGHAIECRINAEHPRSLHAIGGKDYRVQRAGRKRNSRGYGALCRGSDSAVLRLADCQADCPRGRSRGGDGQDGAGTEPVHRARDRYFDLAARGDLSGCGVQGGRIRYGVYGTFPGGAGRGGEAASVGCRGGLRESWQRIQCQAYTGTEFPLLKVESK